MTSSRPYLLRAIHEWILDNGMTPQILVRTDAGVSGVPAGYFKDGRVVLNISPQAAAVLEITNEGLSFRARFDGASRDVIVPISAVHAIYARENGRGMVLPDEDPPDGAATPPQAPGKVSLQIVK